MYLRGLTSFLTIEISFDSVPLFTDALIMISEVEKNELKAVIKESISEVFEQKKVYFTEVLEEIIEDKLFLEAIKAEEDSGIASRDEVFEVLKS